MAKYDNLQGLNILSGITDMERPDLGKIKLPLGSMSEAEIQLQNLKDQATMLLACQPETYGKTSKEILRIIDDLRAGKKSRRVVSRGLEATAARLYAIAANETMHQPAIPQFKGYTKAQIGRDPFIGYDAFFFNRLHALYLEYKGGVSTIGQKFSTGDTLDADLNYFFWWTDSNVATVSWFQNTPPVTNPYNGIPEPPPFPGLSAMRATKDELKNTFLNWAAYDPTPRKLYDRMLQDHDPYTKTKYVEEYIHYSFRDGDIGTTSDGTKFKKNISFTSVYGLLSSQDAAAQLSAQGNQKRGVQASYLNSLTLFSGLSPTAINGLVTNGIIDSMSATPEQVRAAIRQSDAKKTGAISGASIGIDPVTLTVLLIIAILSVISALAAIALELIKQNRVKNNSSGLEYDKSRADQTNAQLQSILDSNGFAAACDTSSQDCSDFQLQYQRQQGGGGNGGGTGGNGGGTNAPTGGAKPTGNGNTNTSSDSNLPLILGGGALLLGGLYLNNKKNK